MDRPLGRLVTVALAGLIASAVGAVDASARGEQRDLGDSSVFAAVPPPGNPEAVAVRGNTVFTGTTTSGVEWLTGTATMPSHVFAFDRRTGELEYAVAVEGEDLSRIHGLAGLAVDGDGRLYAADVQQGILRFDLAKERTRQEVYATFPDLPPCLATSSLAPCSPTHDDREPLPNEVVFDEAGNLYVTDSWQATIWRVPPGGGEARIWFQDARLDGNFGPNGIAISSDREWVYVAQTYTGTLGGALWRIPFVEQPGAADLELLRTWPHPDPDGMAFGRSGLLYLVLGSSEAISVLEPDGTEVARHTSEHFHNPASPAFDEAGSLLVANHAFFDLDPAHSSLAALYVDDRAEPLARPRIP